jgi:hypothetical protein
MIVSICYLIYMVVKLLGGAVVCSKLGYRWKRG